MKKIAIRVLLAVLCLCFVFLLGAYRYTHPGRGPRLAVDPHEKGSLETIDGTTVLHLKGSPYEMGFQHGALAPGDVKKAMGRFETLLSMASEEAGVPQWALELYLDYIYARCAPNIPDRYEREMEGLADGAGADLQLIRRTQVISVITERSCSSFAVFGKATGNGKVFHGRNFDWIMEVGLQDSAVLLVFEPDGMVPFAAPSYFGTVGVVSGMNMEGIAIGQIGAITDDSRSDGIPMMLLLRRVLEEAHDADEAVAVFQNARRTVGYNYVIADGDTGEARAIETSANHCAVFSDNDPKETVEYALPMEDAVFRSDEAMDQTVRSFQRCSNGYPNLPYGSGSYDHRYKGMATRIEEHYGAIDQAVALDIVKAVAMTNANLHGVLCDCTTREMWVAHAAGDEGAYKQPYVHYDLKKLLGVPKDGEPVL